MNLNITIGQAACRLVSTYRVTQKKRSSPKLE